LRALYQKVKRLAPAPVPLLLAGCDGPLSSLEPAGPVAAEVAWLWWGMLAGAVAISLLVFVMVAMGFGAPRVKSTSTGRMAGASAFRLSC